MMRRSQLLDELISRIIRIELPHPIRVAVDGVDAAGKILDMSRLICLWRVLKRAVLYRNERRPDMAEGCPEKLNWEFIGWVWRYPERTRPKVIALLEKSAGSKQVIGCGHERK